MWLPVGQHPGHRVPYLGLGSHEEVGIVSQLESQQVSGVINQDVFPYIAGFGEISTRKMSQRISIYRENHRLRYALNILWICWIEGSILQDNIEKQNVFSISQYICYTMGEKGTADKIQILCLARLWHLQRSKGTQYNRWMLWIWSIWLHQMRRDEEELRDDWTWVSPGLGIQGRSPGDFFFNP